MPWKDPEVRRQKRREWYDRTREKRTAYFREYTPVYERQPEVKTKRRLKHVEKTYGLGPEEYLQMILDQNNCCAICHKPEMKITRQGDTTPLCVDHCHKTGKVRALLCAKCNGMLGMVDDSVDHLRAAIDYLDQHRGE